MKKLVHRHLGITIIELVVGSLIAAVAVLCIGFVLFDNHRSYNETYDKALPDASRNELVMKALFNEAVRQSSSSDNTASIGSNGEWLEVQYYSNSTVSDPDRFALFYTSGNTLYLRKGVLETQEELSNTVVCDNVNSVKFSLTGKSARMFLDFDDGTNARRVNVSAVMRSP